MSDDSGIAERFRYIRTKSGLKQKDFAESLGVSHSVISDIERGAREPSRKVLTGVAKLYHIDLNWLLLGVGSIEQTSHNQTSNPEIERLEREIDELKKSIDELERENKELSKELLDRMRQLLELRSELGHATA